MREERELQKTFSKKEVMERLLSNLMKLHLDGSISPDQYTSLKQDYSQTLLESSAKLEQIKRTILERIESEKIVVAGFEQDLKNLEVRLKVGELKTEEFQKMVQKIKGKLDKNKRNISNMEQLFKSTSSADVGGFVEESKGFTIPTSLQPMDINLDPNEIIQDRPRLISLIGGVLMLVSIALPWISIMYASGSAFDVSPLIGIFGILGGLGGAGFVFLEDSTLRGKVHLGIGILGLLILGVVWMITNIQISGYGQLTQQFLGGVTIREGTYIFIISAIAMIIGGKLELK